MKTPIWCSFAGNIAALTITGLLTASVAAFADNPNRIALSRLGTYASGVFGAGAAEIVAHDPATQRLFVINAQAATVDVLSIQNPSAPEKVGTIDVTPYGAVANGVAVRDGIVAVAVENFVKTSPGKVVFFNTNFGFLSQVTVGALPDMLIFTPNGRFVLVANEGEPNDNYTIDPEGSVSIIDLSGGVAKLTQKKVRTAGFSAFNSATLDPSIRVFGPNKSGPPGAIASVAQDMEPEYIAVSHDSKTAWVTCQENNALAILDIPSGRITRLVGLGSKDHSLVDAATLYPFDPIQLPAIGTTMGLQDIFLGVFSGLFFEGVDPVTGRYRFVTHTDRGPNAEPTGLFRPFLLPEFTPEIVRFELDRATGRISLTQRIPLQRAPGQPLTGLPNTAIDASASTPYNDEIPVDLFGDTIEPLDPLGADLEGVVIDPSDHSFWMVDEYRPAIYHFDVNGILIQRYVPIGTAAAAGAAPGTFGQEVLPAVLAQRRQNRGFEAVALDTGKIYAFVQSPLRNPATLGNTALNGMRNIRVVEFDPVSLATRQFLYVMDNPDLGAGTNTRADKIGDAVAVGGGEFLVVERDDDAVPGDVPGLIEKNIYRFNLAGATDISSFTGTVGGTGKTVDQLTVTEMALNGIRPIDKRLHIDLTAAAYHNVQKVEGLAVIDPWTIAVINDNDFGVSNITLNGDGTFTRNAPPEPVQLGLIEFNRANRLDASDRDGLPVLNPANPAATLTTGKIDIRPWPVKGMYLPDAIAAYKVGNETFLVMGNEGDAREYIFKNAAGVDEVAFDEQVRVGSVNLDPVKFPNATWLKNSANLGRLRITNTQGRNPATGLYEELYSFGARSFSIRDTQGRLIFDSGDDFEWITSAAYPGNFNTSHSNNTIDDRSDDKGPEPEGVVVGKAFGNDYAFIGLERIGGVMVYDISDPRAPDFVQYINNRDFSSSVSLPGPVSNPAAGDLGPEGLVFIKAEDSPNGRPLLVVGNEISGTTTVFEINKLK